MLKRNKKRFFSAGTCLALIITVGFIPFLSSCKRRKKLTIASKDFTEQKILAEMIGQIFKDQNIPYKIKLSYGNTFKCFDDLKHDRIDIYPEYLGTGMALMGKTERDHSKSPINTLNKLYKPLGIKWMIPFGFSNNYVLAVTKKNSTIKNLKNISSLSNVKNLKIACSEEFLQRPVDGLYDLLRRYGIKKPAKIISLNKEKGIYELLLNGKADVAVLYSTNPAIYEYRLKTLKDDLSFFPLYQAAIAVNTDITEEYSQLYKILSPLNNLISSSKMTELIRKVEIEGQSPEKAAENFLVAKGILKSEKKQKKFSNNAMIFAVSKDDPPSGFAGTALLALRHTFSGRNVVKLNNESPKKMLKSGKARIALLNADEFFKWDSEKNYPVPDENFIPYVAAGYKMFHLFVSEKSQINKFSEIKNLGISGSRADIKICRQLTKILNSKLIPVAYTSKTKMLKELSKRKLDAGLILSQTGIGSLIENINKYSLKLIPIPKFKGSNSLKYPFIRASRIPSDTYPNQNKKIETLALQAILAGFVKNNDSVQSTGATAVISHIQPLLPSQIKKLQKHLVNSIPIDSSISYKSEFSKGIRLDKKDNKTLNDHFGVSLLNALAVAGLIYLFFLFINETKTHRKYHPLHHDK